MNRRNFIRSAVIAFAAASATPGVIAGVGVEHFEMVMPFEKRGNRIWFNKKYSEAEFRGWVYRAKDEKFYFQIRRVDDPPKDCIVMKDMWPMKFRIAP